MALQDAAFSSISAGTVGLQAANDMNEAADILSIEAEAATSTNERLAVLNQGVVFLIRAQSQTNELLSQTLRLLAAREVNGLRTDMKPTVSGGRQ